MQVPMQEREERTLLASNKSPGTTPGLLPSRGITSVRSAVHPAEFVAQADYGIFLNEHVEHEAAIVFQHACKLGLEGIVSKRGGSPYVSGRSSHWLKFKNPNSAAVKREAE